MSARAPGQRYHRNEREKLLLRPDQVIGAVTPRSVEGWFVHDGHLERSAVRVAPGLFKIVDEVVTNVIDQHFRVKQRGGAPVRKLAIDVDADAVTVSNDGEPVPVVPSTEHPDAQWLPTLLFGVWNTSDSYDQEEADRTLGSVNGVGVKAANVFSHEFTVEIHDPHSGKKFSQTWTNNMGATSGPRLSSFRGKTPKMTVRFRPDWARFGGRDDEALAGLVKSVERRAFDAAALTGMKVTFNGARVPVSGVEQLAGLVRGADRVFKMSSPGWELCVMQSPTDQFEQLSFVNGLTTPDGGTHVEHVVGPLVRGIADVLNRTDMRRFVRDKLMVVVSATVPAAAFLGQIKASLTTRATDFRPKFVMDDGVFRKVLQKLPALKEAIEAMAADRAKLAMAKSDGKRRSRINVPKLDDALLAGTKNSADCTLVLTEGDSAAASAVAAVAATAGGRRTYGVFPLRGKVMNVRGEGFERVAKNEEISNIKKIIGLESNKRYASVDGLRYGSVVVLTDADNDGSHIKGLVQNLFHVYWPELLEMGYVSTVLTPIVKASRGKETRKFYSQPEVAQFVRGLGGARAKWVFKYYKGLGTSTNAEAREFFKDNKLQKYRVTDASADAMALAFDEGRADDRKEWIRRAGKTPPAGVDPDLKDVPLEAFVNNDLVLYSVASVERAIPSAIDGMKPSQRKILFAALKRASTEVKLVQLAGFVSEKAAYHHGEASLNQAIVAMAQNFPGSGNNANLLEPIGQFGTRRTGGKDSAQPRYISTRLAPVADLAFRREDEPLLEYLEDDGTKIEPAYYVPVIPWSLCNALHGIGTGFACDSPPYNPLDVISAVRARLAGRARGPALRPWFRGTAGRVRDSPRGGFEVVGKYRVANNVVHVEDLPAGLSNEKFAAHLEKLVEARVVKDYANVSASEREARFDVTLADAALAADAGALEKKLGLVRPIKVNMTMWSAANEVKTYESADEVIDEFVPVRREMYVKRRALLISSAELQAADAAEKARFISEVIDGTLDVRGPMRAVEQRLRDAGYAPRDGYAHLLNMPMSSMTQERAEDLRKKQREAQRALQSARDATPETLWEKDLDSLQEQLQRDIDNYDP